MWWMLTEFKLNPHSVWLFQHSGIFGDLIVEVRLKLLTAGFFNLSSSSMLGMGDVGYLGAGL